MSWLYSAPFSILLFIYVQAVLELIIFTECVWYATLKNVIVTWLHLTYHFCLKVLCIEMTQFAYFIETASDQTHQALQLSIMFF